MLEAEKNKGTHELSLCKREELKVKGVCDVISFDENCIVLLTLDGVLSAEGADMHLKSFDTEAGGAEISGRVSALIYSDGSQRGGFFRRRSR